MVVSDNNKRPYPLIPEPDDVQHQRRQLRDRHESGPARDRRQYNVSPLSTDVTSCRQGVPRTRRSRSAARSTRYVEDASHNLLAITGTKLYPIAQPALTFKLDSSLSSRCARRRPPAGNYAGSVVPDRLITAGTTARAGDDAQPLRGHERVGRRRLLHVQERPVHAAQVGGRLRRGAKDLHGLRVTAGRDPAATRRVRPGRHDLPRHRRHDRRDGNARRDQPGDAVVPDGDVADRDPVRPGLRTGFHADQRHRRDAAVRSDAVPVPGHRADRRSPPGPRRRSTTSSTRPGRRPNVVQVDVPTCFPTFTQTAPFNFSLAYPLTIETGGYNAFTHVRRETSLPAQSFAGAFRTPLISTDPADRLADDAQGDFSLEFWHSLPSRRRRRYHPFTYQSSTQHRTAQPPGLLRRRRLRGRLRHLRPDQQHGHAGRSSRRRSSPRGGGTSRSPTRNRTRWSARAPASRSKNGTNYNFSRDFSIAMTFCVTDVNTPQGLLYKGTGRRSPSPEFVCRIRVGVESGNVTLTLTDGTGQTHTVQSSSGLDRAGQLLPGHRREADRPRRSGTSGQHRPVRPPFSADFGSCPRRRQRLRPRALPSIGHRRNHDHRHPADRHRSTPQPKLLTTSLSIHQPELRRRRSRSRAVTTTAAIGTLPSYAASHRIRQRATRTSRSCPTGNAHLLIGTAYDDNGTERRRWAAAAQPATSATSISSTRAIDPTGIKTSGRTDRRSRQATTRTAHQARHRRLLAGARTTRTASSTTPSNQNDVAMSTNALRRPRARSPATSSRDVALHRRLPDVARRSSRATRCRPSMTGPTRGLVARLQRRAVQACRRSACGSMARQQYQVIDDMFGRLVTSNEPFLVLYLSGSFAVADRRRTAILPMNNYIDSITVTNESPRTARRSRPPRSTSSGCPAVGRCGPLITPNLYTPPGVALTVCDTPPSLTTYSVTLNNARGTLAGEINEAYVVHQRHRPHALRGQEGRRPRLTWVSQEQGDVQIIGYIEGAPPAPDGQPHQQGVATPARPRSPSPRRPRSRSSTSRTRNTTRATTSSSTGLADVSAGRRRR